MKKYFFLILLFTISLSLDLFAQNGNNHSVLDSAKLELNAEQIIEQNKSALVSIFYHSDVHYSYYKYEVIDTTLLSGSGFIVNKEGLIGTNYHVIESIDSLIIKTSDGSFYNAELVFVDIKNDLAILKIMNSEKEFPYVKIGNSDDVKVGQNVFAIGSPFGYEYTISQGIVAGIRENERVNFYDPISYMPVEKIFDKVIQITAAISPGNSGGALFNSKGEVIGITTYTYTGYGNLNFAVAINKFKELKNSLEIDDKSNGDFVKKKEESRFNTNLKLAENFKSFLYSNWYYSKQRDTLKSIDTFIVKQDSLNKINFSKSEKFYLKCIELQPDSFYVYQGLMDLYVFTEHYQDAEKLYKSVIDKFSSDSLLNLLSSSLAEAYSSSKDYKNALQFYEKMLKEDTASTFIMFQIADIYEKMEDYKTAIKKYKYLIKKDSTYIEAYIAIGKLYYEHYKNYDLAGKYLSLAIEKQIGLYGYSAYNIDLYYYSGLIAIAEGRMFDAVISYMELKNIYGYNLEDNKKKLALYKAIKEAIED